MYLDGMLDAYKDPNDPDAVVSFNRTVTLEDGLYFTDSFMDYADVCPYSEIARAGPAGLHRPAGGQHQPDRHQE